MGDEFNFVSDNEHPPTVSKRRYAPPPLITQQDVERKMHKSLGPAAVFGQDFVWDTLVEVAQRAIVLWPLRKCIQRLACKHKSWESFWSEVFPLLVARCELEQPIRRLASKYGGDSSPNFQREVERLVHRHAKKLKVQNAVPAPNVITVPEDCSQRQLRGLAELVPLVELIFAGKPVEMKPEELSAIWTALTARRSGPPRSDFAGKVLTLHRSAREQGVRRTDGEIAAAVFGDEYIREKDGTKRIAMRERVRRIRRYEQGIR